MAPIKRILQDEGLFSTFRNRKLKFGHISEVSKNKIRVVAIVVRWKWNCEHNQTCFIHSQRPTVVHLTFLEGQSLYMF